MRITINLNRKEITDDILAKSNLLARQMARNPETEELAGDIMTPDDEQVKPIVARALTEAATPSRLSVTSVELMSVRLPSISSRILMSILSRPPKGALKDPPRAWASLLMTKGARQ